MTPAKPLPGARLLRIARNLFDDAIVSGVLEPTIADLQEECVVARTGADRLLARWRGYFAFWSIVILAPITLRQWPGHRRRARAFVGWMSTIGVVIVLAVAWRPIMEEVIRWLFAGPGTLKVAAAAGGFAFLAGPVALAFVGVRRWTGGPPQFRLGAAEAMMFSLLSITVAIPLGVAGVMYTFSEIGARGSAGIVQVVNGLSVAIRPVLYALATFCLCAVAIAAMSFRGQPGGRTEPDTLPAASTGTAVVCAALLCLVVVSVDQLLRLNHQMMEWLFVFTSPPKPGSSGKVLMEGFSESVNVVMSWGIILTAGIMAAAFYTWRALRERVAHPFMTWTARVALIAVIGSVAWHADVLNTNLQQIEQLLDYSRTARPPAER